MLDPLEAFACDGRYLMPQSPRDRSEALRRLQTLIRAQPPTSPPNASKGRYSERSEGDPDA